MKSFKEKKSVLESKTTRVNFYSKVNFCLLEKVNLAKACLLLTRMVNKISKISLVIMINSCKIKNHSQKIKKIFNNKRRKSLKILLTFKKKEALWLWLKTMTKNGTHMISYNIQLLLQGK
jgi:hypothetical protein